MSQVQGVPSITPADAAAAQRESGPATRVFPTMLGLFVAAEIPQFFVPAMGWWRVFAEWYGSLPLI